MSFKERYLAERTELPTRGGPEPPPSNSIVGTACAVIEALFSYVDYIKAFSCVKGVITDGYYMVLLSPFIITYWLILAVLFIPVYSPIVLLYILALIYTIVFEFPAAYVNKERLDSYYIPEKDKGV